MAFIIMQGKAAIPPQAWTDLEDSWKLRPPEFLDNWHMKVARSPAVRTGCLYPPGDIHDTHVC